MHALSLKKGFLKCRILPWVIRKHSENQTRKKEQGERLRPLSKVQFVTY